MLHFVIWTDADGVEQTKRFGAAFTAATFAVELRRRGLAARRVSQSEG